MRLLQSKYRKKIALLGLFLLTIFLIVFVGVPFLGGISMSISPKWSGFFRSLALINPYAASFGIESGIHDDGLIHSLTGEDVFLVSCNLEKTRRKAVGSHLRRNAEKYATEINSDLILSFAELLEGSNPENVFQKLKPAKIERLKKILLSCKK